MLLPQNCIAYGCGPVDRGAETTGPGHGRRALAGLAERNGRGSASGKHGSDGRRRSGGSALTSTAAAHDEQTRREKNQYFKDS